jgi:hypothetical protein
MALASGLLGFAERFAEQTADRPRRLAAGPLAHPKALVGSALGVVGEPRHEEAEDQQQDADPYYYSDDHLAPLWVEATESFRPRPPVDIFFNTPLAIGKPL